jgi:hypothetical protein
MNNKEMKDKKKLPKGVILMEGFISEAERDMKATVSAFKNLEQIGDAINTLENEHQRIRLEVQEKLGIDMAEFERRFRQAKEEGRF